MKKLLEQNINRTLYRYSIAVSILAIILFAWLIWALLVLKYNMPYVVKTCSYFNSLDDAKKEGKNCSSYSYPKS